MSEEKSESSHQEPNQLSAPDALYPVPSTRSTAATAQATVSPTKTGARDKESGRHLAQQRTPGTGVSVRGRLGGAARCGNSERGLRNTISGKLSQSVRAGKISPRDRDVLHAEAVGEFRAKPVEFAGSPRQQTIQHLRYLQRAIISLIARRELAEVDGGTPALLEKIIADVDHDLGQSPDYHSFDIEKIATAAEPKIVAAVDDATLPARS